MITLYELKSQSFCRCFIRTPFYIKNFVLLTILGLIMTIIYFLHFRKDGGNFLSITKILKGLNSNTFNYLEQNSKSLRLTKLLSNYQAQISSNQFFDECVRISKPCKFEGLAKTWPSFYKLQYNQKLGYDYLKEKLNDMQVEVFLDMEYDQDQSMSLSSGDSFRQSTKTKMKYSDFLKKMNDQSVSVSLKDGHQGIYNSLIEEIALPTFIIEFNDIDSIELIQGKVLVNPAQYDRKEQFLCSIDGVVQIKLIPHVYKQEVYAGKPKIIVDQDASPDQEPARINLEPNQSPIDFFQPDKENYPLYGDIETKYTVLLHEGDCLYIPAFYFNQYVAKSQGESSALSVSLKYKSNSELLGGFYSAIEKNILH
ncbi:UNKNOWN [Stylonychia lemnae]|uniref:Cupin-like domain-containing protein n=1 Tax=Stylonychia lemnae TaxID=5949 RepID=A0A077ZU88_STYLE|nr:UNKNOWN [Stylonychia lemnae]|eukprot:CDW72026.1 UNKNOWN [Stylonychia lemnae]